LSNSNNISSNIKATIEKVLSTVLEKNYFSIENLFDDFKIKVDAKYILRVAKTLKDNEKLKFSQLIDLTAVDYPNKAKRFNIVYIFLSIENNVRIIISTLVKEDESIDSITSLYPAANWYEREVWDLFGISFKNHPDLRRLLTDYGFNGFPLRKDFPLSGNVEVRYDLATKKVIYEPVKLIQDFRDFDFESPWEGTNQSKTND